MQKTNFDIDKPNKWLNPKLWFIVFLILSVTKTILAFTIPFNGIEIWLLVMHKSVVLSGLICAWYGCNALVRWCMNRSWFIWLSAFSFMIYVLHAPLVVYATKAVFMMFSDWYGYRVLTFILLPLCLIAMAVIFGALLRKLFPKLYSFVTGGRGLG